MEFFGFNIPTPLILAILVVLLSYVYLTWDHGYWVNRGIPGPKPYPLIGTLDLTKNPIDLDLEGVKEYGKVVGGFIFGQPTLKILDANMIKQILVKDFHNFTDKSFMARRFSKGEKYMDAMISNLQGEEWKRVRNTITPAFSASKLKVMIEHVNNKCEMLLETFRKIKEDQVEVKKYTDAYILDVMARVAFGVEIDTQKDPDSPFLVNGRKVFEFSISWRHPERLIMFFMPPLYRLLRKIFPDHIRLIPKEATEYFMSLIRDVMKHRGDGKAAGSVDLIQMMLNAHNLEESPDEVDTEIGGTSDKPVSKKRLTEEEVVAQSFIMLTAGFETTSSSITFFLYNMATNPDCQEKLQQEIDQVVGDSKTITYDMTHKMPYLDMCINESLRSYPPIMRTDRYSNHEVTIDGITIPKHMNVIASIGALHYDAKVWPEPRKYDPERFSPDAKAKRDPIYFMPFSYGPRNCIGMRIAQLELRLSIIKIFQNFNVKACEKTQIPLKLSVVPTLLKPEQPIFVSLEPRY